MGELASGYNKKEKLANRKSLLGAESYSTMTEQSTKGAE